MGIESNPKKAEDGVYATEVHGVEVRGRKKTAGVSLAKRRLLFQAVWRLLAEDGPVVKAAERVLGKIGFAQSCRACQRSCFRAVYGWLSRVVARRARRQAWTPEVYYEFVLASWLILAAQFRADGDWCERVECADSSMSGIGRAWSCWPANLVAEAARYADCRGACTNLRVGHSIEVDEKMHCPLRRVVLPLGAFRWRVAGARCGPSHVTLGEADAAVWGLGERLRRPGERGAKVLHSLDSAVCVGAFSKGRSQCWLLNRRCQKLAAVMLAGDLEVFWFLCQRREPRLRTIALLGTRAHRETAASRAAAAVGSRLLGLQRSAGLAAAGAWSAAQRLRRRPDDSTCA